jgi:4-amino-4-deoxychorismate lyase
MYDCSRKRVGIASFAEKKEVLLWNSDGDIMEGSITSIYIWRNEEGWITPELESGCQAGTTRRWALKQGIATPGVVKHDELKPGIWVVLSNGVKGFWGGWVS